jgi:hypothetical protein
MISMGLVFKEDETGRENGGFSTQVFPESLDRD